MKISRLRKGSERYPTGQQVRIASLSRELKRKIRRVYAEAAKRVDVVPVAAMNAYQYAVTPELMAETRAFLQGLINREFYGNDAGIWESAWFMNAYLSGASEDAVRSVYGQVTAQASSSTALGPSLLQMVKMRTVEMMLFEPGYLRRLQGVYGRVFESMKGLTGSMLDDIAQQLAQGMAAGRSPREIAERITERASVSESRALRIARTEINTVFNRASDEEAVAWNEDVFGDSDWRLDDMHLSAMLSTTRRDHAARHGTVSTQEEQQRWWDTVASGGRINCYCTVIHVLRNRKTGELMQRELVAEVESQRTSLLAIEGK